MKPEENKDCVYKIIINFWQTLDLLPQSSRWNPSFSECPWDINRNFTLIAYQIALRLIDTK